MELLATSLWQTHASAFGEFGQLTHDAGKEFRMISFYGKIFEFWDSNQIKWVKVFFRLLGLVLKKKKKNWPESKSHINVLTFSSQELTEARNKSPCLSTRRWPGRVSLGLMVSQRVRAFLPTPQCTAVPLGMSCHLSCDAASLMFPLRCPEGSTYFVLTCLCICTLCRGQRGVGPRGVGIIGITGWATVCGY